MPKALLFHIASLGVYGAALVAFVVGVARAGRRWTAAGLGLGAAAVLLNLGALIARGREVGHVPFQAVYEICLLIAAVPLVTYAMVYLVLRFHAASGTRGRVAAGIGALAAVTSILAMGGAVWAGDRHLLLPPALQSAYFVPHVLVYVVAYGVLGLAALTGLAYLILHYAVWRSAALQVAPDAAVLPALRDGSAALLDEVGQALMAVGFAFLTMGLIFGCLWAQLAWGAWWSWDVKETWALIGWLVYLMYFHLRLVRGWRGVRSAWLAFLGGAAIAICFVLLDYLPGSSLHKYM